MITELSYDFAKLGPVLHGYPPDTDLGFQQIKPMALDELSDKLKVYNTLVSGKIGPMSASDAPGQCYSVTPGTLIQ